MTETDGQESLFGDAGHAHARRGDPETSHEAAESLTDLGEKQWSVLVLMRVIGDATDAEIAERYAIHRTLPDQSASGLRTRRKELVDRGYVADTGRRARLSSGRRAIIWGVVSEATRRRLRDPD